VNLTNNQTLSENSKIQIASAGIVVGKFKSIQIIHPMENCISAQLEYLQSSVSILFQFQCPQQSNILIPVVISAGLVAVLTLIAMVLIFGVKPIRDTIFPHREKKKAYQIPKTPVPAIKTSYSH